MAELAAAVVGTGSMGRNHARIYSELDDVRLIALADPCESALNPLAQEYGAAAYADYQELLRKEKPDIVSVATPNSLHKEVALAAIESGAHVLVEKPLAPEPRDGWAIVEAAARRSVKLTVGHTERFNPAVRKLCALQKQGALGRIFQIHARRMSPFPQRIRDVGVVIDLAIHDLDVMLHLLGPEVSTIYAETTRGIHSEYEDSLLGLLRFRDGILGILDINWISPTKIRELVVTGENGMFIVDYLNQELHCIEPQNGATGLGAAPPSSDGQKNGRVSFACKKEESLKAELEDFVRCIQLDRPPLVRPEEALAVLDIAHKLIEAGREQKVLTSSDGLCLAER